MNKKIKPGANEIKSKEDIEVLCCYGTTINPLHEFIVIPIFNGDIKVFSERLKEKIEMGARIA